MEDRQYVIDELAGKYLSGELTEEERNCLMRWINSDAENKAYFEQLRNIWQVSAPAFAPEEVDVERALRKVMRRTGERSGKRIEIMLWWQRIAAVLFLPVLLGAGYLLWHVHRVSADSRTAYQEISSPFGLCSKVELPDGSTVWLNSGSKLRYPVNFSGKLRNLHLSGEAFFSVHSDKEHPFVVNTKDLVVAATGTQFNIEAYSNDTVTSVTLLKGALDVNIDKMRVRLSPDRRIVYNNLSTFYSVTETDAARRCLWKDGILAFRGEPLSEVFKRIGRTFNVNIVMKDDSISRQPYRATFQDESFGEILNLLKLTVPIKYKWKERVRFDDGTFSKNEVEVLRKE